MTISEIVKEYLIKNGYDGLYQKGECACIIADLFPCSEPSENCTAGHKNPCDCGDHDYHIGSEKPKE